MAERTAGKEANRAISCRMTEAGSVAEGRWAELIGKAHITTKQRRMAFI
jgi:hypothetical protein